MFEMCLLSLKGSVWSGCIHLSNISSVQDYLVAPILFETPVFPPTFVRSLERVSLLVPSSRPTSSEIYLEERVVGYLTSNIFFLPLGNRRKLNIYGIFFSFVPGYKIFFFFWSGGERKRSHKNCNLEQKKSLELP